MSPESPDPGALERQALEDFRAGRRAAAAEGFRTAQDRYLALGDRLRAAQAANNLSVALLQSGRAPEALQAVEGTPEVFAQAGDELRRAEALGNWAAALEAVGRLDEAERRYREAAEMFQGQGRPDEEAHTRRALAAVLLRLGQPYGATSAMQRALESDPRGGWKNRWLRRILDALSRRGGV